MTKSRNSTKLRSISAAGRRSQLPPIAGRPLAEIIHFMESIAPPCLAEDWDHVGLLSSPRNRDQPIKRVLIALDLTARVRDKALAAENTLLVCYHPPLLKPVENLCVRDQTPASLAVELSQNNVWVYSPHTALDIASGGTNDCLAAELNLSVTGSLLLKPAKGATVKLVVFIPESHLEQVAAAVFEAGAGKIGINSRYTQCSFRTRGTGTFFGDESTSPAAGRKGQLEFVPEIRFETIVPRSHLAPVVAALRASHPYEEPAFDLLAMENPPEEPGLGRIARFSQPLTLGQIARNCRSQLKLKAVAVIGDPQTILQSAAIIAGSSGSEPASTMKLRMIDCLITGELKHHDMLHYAGMGLSAICLGHAASEQPVLRSVARRLKAAYPQLNVQVLSGPDDSPILWM